MSTVQVLYEKTLQVMSSIQIVTAEQLEELLELRDEVIAVLSQSPVISLEDKEYINQLTQFDEPIIKRMNVLKDEAAQGIKKIDNNRKQRSSYDAQYDGTSYFIDIRN